LAELKAKSLNDFDFGLRNDKEETKSIRW